MRHVLLLLVVATMVPLSGCSRLSTEYGESKGLAGRTSLNGFAALRRAFEQAGFRSRDVSRLSNRVQRTDVIVWTPKGFGAVDDAVTRWFDRWLRQGKRTLIYVVPDSGSEADYWLDAAKLAPPEQRLEYRKRAARCINQRIEWRLNRSPVDSNGWFRIDALDERRSVQSGEGPWRDVYQPADDPTGERIDGTLPEVEYTVVPYDPKAGTQGSGGTVMPMLNAAPIGPGNPGWMMPVTTTVSSTPVQYTPLLSIDAESPFVGEVRAKQWRDSKILVVAGGSLLTNYAFSQDANRRLADRIIAESVPNSKSEHLVGFLTSDWGNVPVSEREADAPRTSGMEMLTEWPISMVTMHGVVLGMVVCLILIPIFGRPKKVRRTESNDFGHHLDAVAALMKRAGGEAYARGRISDYFKRMHGETTGPWVLPDRSPSTKTKPSPRTGGKPLTSSEASSGSSRDAEGQQAPDDGERSRSATPQASTPGLETNPSESSDSLNQDEADR